MRPPDAHEALQSAAAEHGFIQSSDREFGELLAALAATAPGGRILELGTGVGTGTARLLAGMDATAQLTTVELEESLQSVARTHLGDDPRVTWVVGDGGAWLTNAVADGLRFDLVFADTWPGKFSHRAEAMSLVAPSGIYLIDDLFPHPGWPEGHQSSVDALRADLEQMEGWAVATLEWASGIMMCVRRS